MLKSFQKPVPHRAGGLSVILIPGGSTTFMPERPDWTRVLQHCSSIQGSRWTFSPIFARA